MGGEVRLDWGLYRGEVTQALHKLVQAEEFVDVTLHTEGRVLRAHRVYLSACSPYFSSVLRGTSPWQLPVLFLAIPYQDLSAILEFIYHGCVSVPRTSLPSLLRSATSLQIRGLAAALAQGGRGEARGREEGEREREEEVGSKRRRTEGQAEETSNSTDVAAEEEAEVAAERVDIKEEVAEGEEMEQVVVKADPGDFHREEGGEGGRWGGGGDGEGGGAEERWGAARGGEEGGGEGDWPGTNLAVRSDLLGPPGPLYGERGRCHFCSLLCEDRASLTRHLVSAHQPAKHSLCENCENFFHICAIQRHRQKCKARYVTDR